MRVCAYVLHVDCVSVCVCVCVLYSYNSTANRTSKHHPQSVVVADFQSSRFQLANIAGEKERERGEGRGEREKRVG